MEKRRPFAEVMADRIKAGKRPGGFTITNQGDKSIIRIYDEIGVFGVTDDQVAQALDGVRGPEIEVQINSLGGDVFMGIGIYNALRAHPAKVTTRVDAMAASVASVIAQAGDKRVILSSGQLAIHNAWGLAIGDANDMRRLADILDRQSDVIAGIYAERSGRPKAVFARAMDAETWYTDEEAVSAGLADQVLSLSTSNSFNASHARRELEWWNRRYSPAQLGA